MRKLDKVTNVIDSPANHINYRNLQDENKNWLFSHSLPFCNEEGVRRWLGSTCVFFFLLFFFFLFLSFNLMVFKRMCRSIAGFLPVLYILLLQCIRIYTPTFTFFFLLYLPAHTRHTLLCLQHIFTSFEFQWSFLKLLAERASSFRFDRIHAWIAYTTYICTHAILRRFDFPPSIGLFLVSATAAAAYVERYTIHDSVGFMNRFQSSSTTMIFINSFFFFFFFFVSIVSYICVFVFAPTTLSIERERQN